MGVWNVVREWRTREKEEEKERERWRRRETDMVGDGGREEGGEFS